MTVLWQEVEYGAYGADLPLWEELADEREGPVLDLGCGFGRVALHLACRGHRVHGLDLDPVLVSALNERAADLPAEADEGDARQFELDRRFDLILAPMQLIQIFADAGERVRCLRAIAAHLTEGGLAALAIVADPPAPVDAPPPLPDTRETDGWIYSSLPLEPAIDGERIVVRRLRQTVSPAGELSEEVDEVALGRLTASALEEEATVAGLRPAGRREVAASADHVGSTVVLLEGGS